MTSALIKFSSMARNALHRDRGATAVEYGLMVALIAVVIIGVVMFLGGQLSGVFDEVGQSISEVRGGGDE